MKNSALAQKATLACDLVRLSLMTGSAPKTFGYLKRGLKPDIISGKYRGLHFCARKEDWLAIKEVFLRDEYGLLEKLFKSNESAKILDLGANMGCFALRAFAHAPKSSIYSVEAARDTAEILRQNIQLNAQLDWRFIQAAVWKNNEDIYLQRTVNSIGHRVGENDTGEKIQGLSLNQIFENTGWSEVDLIKIDIEGAEGEVVPVSRDILSKAKYVLIEIHNDRIDGEPVFQELNGMYPHHYRINNRASSKPVLLFSRKAMSL